MINKEDADQTDCWSSAVEEIPHNSNEKNAHIA